MAAFAASAHAADPTPEQVLSPALQAQFKAFLSQTAQAAKSTRPMPDSATPVAPQTPATAGSNAGAEVAAAPAKADPAAVDALLALASAPTPSPGFTAGLASSQGLYPGLPDADTLDKEAADAITAAFKAKPGTLDQASQLAADTTTAAPDDPAYDERVALAQTLYLVDGSDALVRHFVATEHMRLIVQAVAKAIDIPKLSETDRYRLSAIVTGAETELQDKIILMSAKLQADNLTRQDLLELIVAYDNDAQRKVTQMRLNDSGRLDKATSLDVTISQYQIVKAFEAAQP